MRNWGSCGIGREGLTELGREGIADELGCEDFDAEAMGLCAGFFGMAFLVLLAEASTAAEAAESSLNLFTASFATLASLA